MMSGLFQFRREMKTSDLTGSTLDYWVAKAEGIDVVSSGVYPDGSRSILTYDSRDGSDFTGCKTYSPSKDWAQGGRLIERYKIGMEWDLCCGDWCAGIDYKEPITIGGNKGHSEYTLFVKSGNTLLESAMRCLVASKFGDEVPDIAEGE
jgi:hypothetical protein